MFYKLLLGVLVACCALVAMVKIKFRLASAPVSAAVDTMVSKGGAITCPKCRVYEPTQCSHAGCSNGRLLCPADCLKREVGPWIHMHVDGHSDSELWRRFDYPNGGWNAWSQAHIGELIVQENGKAVNKGKCPTCGGTTRVTCPDCAAKPACEVCNNTGVAEDSACRDYLAKKVHAGLLSTFRTKDGRVFVGKVATRVNKRISLRLPDGSSVILKESELAEG